MMVSRKVATEERIAQMKPCVKYVVTIEVAPFQN
jgi:hypothetical protein